MNKKDFNPDFNDDDLLVDMTFKVVKFIFTIVFLKQGFTN